MTGQKGKVYLVGAGPSDVAYLTVRAQQLLAQAEVLVYDALVDGRLLHLVPLNCCLFDVGKRGGRPSIKQAEIDRLLVEQCQQGKQVVRLKSGDPFIFGRCGSEIESLLAAGCPFEVVPGISSALAAPLFAGIPLTDPVLSRCFAVLSGHDPAELDWQTLSGIDTLVILMGGRYLAEIVDRLQRYGRSPKTPVAVIRWAGHPQQQVWTGELGNIVQVTAGASLSPAVIAIGEVVGLRPYLLSGDSGYKVAIESEDDLKFDTENPQPQISITVTNTEHPRSIDFQDSQISASLLPSPSDEERLLPLAGKTILVTRSVGQSGEFGDLLQQAGARVIEMPALSIGPPSSWSDLDSAIANLPTFHWLILTSTNGVDYFFERLQAQGKDARALATLKIAVVGKKTAQRLQQHSVIPDFIPPDFVADSLVANFPAQLVGQKILFPRVETGGREVLVQELTAQGAVVVEVPAYQSQCPTDIPPEAFDALQRKAVDAVTFASSKTVQCFDRLVQASLPMDVLEGVCIASIGPQTSKTCQQLLGRVDVEAKEYTLEGLLKALMEI
ncbi:uroporphyrinogen-III C-methyltransferase [Planktothrix sp. FACHB-1355]|uniref:uroporphyrinogen-III C-methyltransferase n=1 Tax=Aerosakkonema funiforme FACHB-1375 TaxID=2949571 RepID=A0A926ZFN0_9CYAN|nr:MULTISPECIES: uroporphyrinogen-III C-methyltransferase [Oscillatoriales]MBD2181313.1 uroporphyrinogen-III C-methyltransferase [Aerosakkonema funiforme FACHB-1375]MBD3557882.1 uroporphyrinogen-III C-methyltransferase [Planktothrix sp. FACHB-1355]